MKQITEIDCDKLRQFCIHNNFYTRGDCEAYSKMFDIAKTYNGDIDILQNIADDIIAHSSGESITNFTYSGMTMKDSVGDIMTEIYRNCVIVWFE